jgi:hypothetical protein
LRRPIAEQNRCNRPPHSQDIAITKACAAALEKLDILLHDNVVVGRKGLRARPITVMISHRDPIPARRQEYRDDQFV